jgi:hypothetical protein
MQSAVEQGKLMIPVAKVMDSGDYTCRVVGVSGNYQATARLEVVASKNSFYYLENAIFSMTLGLNLMWSSSD